MSDYNTQQAAAELGTPDPKGGESGTKDPNQERYEQLKQRNEELLLELERLKQRKEQYEKEKKLLENQLAALRRSKFRIVE